MAYKKKTKTNHRGFLRGSVVNNLPANARDTGSIPGPGRFNMPQINSACIPQRLSQHSEAWDPQLLSPPPTTTEACMLPLQQEKPLQGEAHALTAHCS